MKSRIGDFFRKALWNDPNYEVKQVSCPEITIEAIPNELYEKLLTEAAAAGAEFDGNKMTISGLEFDWNYDTEAQILHVTCTRKPFYVTCAQVETRINYLAEKAKGGI